MSDFSWVTTPERVLISWASIDKKIKLTVSWHQLRETPSLVVLNLLVQRLCPTRVVEDLKTRGCCNIDGGRLDID
jgi:hypothetical protein